MNTEVKVTVFPNGRMSAYPETVRIVPGDTVSFKLVNDDKGAELCMSAKTAEVVFQHPTSTQVDIPAGGLVSFQFATAPNGEYWVMVREADRSGQSDIPEFLPADQAVLKIGVALSGKESGPADTIRPRS